MGFDLNRHWSEPSPWAHPTLYATKNLLMELDRSDVRVFIYQMSYQTLQISPLPVADDIVAILFL